MPLVQMPDGTLVDLPENPTAEDQVKIKAILEKEKPGIVAQLLSGAADLGRGVVKGATSLHEAARGVLPLYGLAGMAGDVASRKAGVPLAKDLPESLLPTPKGDTPTRRLVRGGLEGVGQSVVGGLGMGPARIPLIGGAGGGLGQEAAAQSMGDSPTTRMAGALVGGLAGGLGASATVSGQARSQVSTLASEAVHGIPDATLRKAGQLMEAAKAKGIQLDLAQALEAMGAPAGNLTTIRNLLANDKSGQRLQELLRQQPGDVSLLAQDAISKVPGNSYGLGQASNNVQEAATERLAQVGRVRSGAVRQQYAAVGELPEASQQQAIAFLQRKLTEPGLTDEAKAVANTLLAKFRNAPAEQVDAGSARAALAAAEKPSQRMAAQAQLASAKGAAEATRPMSALDADTAIADAFGQWKGSPTYRTNAKAAGQIKNIGGELNEILKQGSPEIAAAEKLFADISNEVVNPLKQGPVGQFATPRGYLPDRAAATAKLRTMFDEGVDPQSPVSGIRVLGRELNKADPEAFQDAFKSYLTDKVSSLTRPELTGGQMQAPELAKKLYNGLFKDQKQWQGIQDAVSVIAEQNNLNKAEAVRGLRNLGEMLRGASNRPDTVGGLSPLQIEQMSGSSTSANVMRIFGFLPFERAARGVEAVEAGRTLRTFDQLLTTPEGAATLVRLARSHALSPKSQAVLQTFMTGQKMVNTGDVTGQ